MNFLNSCPKKLASFEQENAKIYHDISENHKEIDSLIDQSLENIEHFENKLNFYEKSLVNIRTNFNELEHYSSWEQNQQNKIQLLKTLSDVMKVLEIDPTDINKFFDIKATQLSPELDLLSQQLVDIFQGNLPKGATCVPAIKSKLEKNSMIISIFCVNFSNFIAELIRSKFGESTNYIPKPREDVHKALAIYAPVFNRIKILDPFRYSEISDHYTRIFREFFKKTWDLYFESSTESIPNFDQSLYKKEGHSSLYRNQKEFQLRSNKISQFMNNSLSIVEKISKDLFNYANNFFGLANVEDNVKGTEGESKIKKRGGGELMLYELVKRILDFLPPNYTNYFNELEKIDCLYILEVYVVVESFKKHESDDRFFSELLSLIISECIDRFKNILIVFKNQYDPKKSKKASSDLLKCFQEFIASCSFCLSQNLEENSPPSSLLKDALIFVIDSLSNSFLETGEKVSNEIYLIENLYNLQSCVVDSKLSILSEGRKKIKQKYSEEIQKYVKSSITAPFQKLIGLTEEIDRKIAASYNSAAIQSFIQSNRNEYKKYTKDFNFKSVKKIIEKTHKFVKKQFVDQSLFTSIWHQMSSEIITNIGKIHTALTTYCVKIPEMAVDFEMADLKQFILNIENPS